ncbi:uncharacterized protein LOC128344114 isoform X1 [Hemicordylus capensis]|uniref:uncharacterized protein LOC128344114 isoform X1 n=1 Tax=Hemicordylus capensis TaxID=884348 RepID=UPI002304341C|nr:uncharacterized protein LOC128344114 isoform X1 [Hemicordylus capensis]
MVVAAVRKGLVNHCCCCSFGEGQEWGSGEGGEVSGVRRLRLGQSPPATLQPQPREAGYETCSWKRLASHTTPWVRMKMLFLGSLITERLCNERESLALCVQEDPEDVPVFPGLQLRFNF